MDKALQSKLFEAYPEIFRERHLPIEESAMSWGLQVGDGWYRLIDDLCRDLKSMTEAGSPQAVATQVKDKSGRLRFHVRETDASQRSLIERAEDLSTRTCDVCGAPGSPISSRRMVVTRCAQHAKK